jgi:Xaa-Pro aminopeptidase
MVARQALRLALLLVPAAAAGQTPGGPEAALKADLQARRARVLERLGPEALLLLSSAPARVYSTDVDYEYRQDSNLYYLTGIDQEDTALVLMPGNATRKEILFILPRDPAREHREGQRLGKEEAQARSGIETVHLSGEGESFLSAILAGRQFGFPRDREVHEFDAFFKALEEGRARVFLMLEPKPGLSGPLPPAYEMANRLRERFPSVAIADASPILRDLRQVKTPWEQAALRRSVEISNDAHKAGMKAARPGAYEYEVEAAIEHVYLKRGALGWSYPSIVASGPNATILHYSKSRRRLEPGDLLLVDAACHYEYLTGDITRTYPVSGTYSEAQKAVYRIVLAAQEEAMKVARPGVKTRDVHAKTVEVVKKGLLDLGLITDAAGDQYRTWYTHGSVHWIGMDVHDVGDYERPLAPGMAFVIEPGIYVRADALDNLAPTPENRAFIEKVRPAFEKYKGIGVRIEDSFLLTESGLERLSAAVPRTIEEVESFLKQR